MPTALACVSLTLAWRPQCFIYYLAQRRYSRATNFLSTAPPSKALTFNTTIVYSPKYEPCIDKQGFAIFSAAVYYLVDRKSTRLNSSHVRISYAVFCLKKKKKIDIEV